jgi:hypothetical protein
MIAQMVSYWASSWLYAVGLSQSLHFEFMDIFVYDTVVIAC